MDSAVNVAGKEAAADLAAEEPLESSSLSIAVVQSSGHGPRFSDTGSSLQSVLPPRTPDSILSQEQVTPGLQQHLVAAENRVCKALHQVMESVEIKLSGAVKQAAIDIIDNLGKEAAECIILSQRKVELLQYQLNYNKEQALSMLMQVKRASDAQISDAENKILIERRRVEEAEAKIHSMQESNKKLKAELKRKGQQVEEIQRSISPATAQQSLEVSVAEGSESRKGANRFNVLVREKKTPQIANARNEVDKLALPPAVTTLDRWAKGISVVQAESASIRPLIHSSTGHDVHIATKVQTGLHANDGVPQGRSNLEVEEDFRMAGNGYVTGNPHSQLDSPTNDSGSGSGADNRSVKLKQRQCSSEDVHPAVTQFEVSPSLIEKGQRSSSPKADLESRLAKDSDEEKSSLTIEALYCKDESLPRQVHFVDEYQSEKTHVCRELGRSDRPKLPIFLGKKYADKIGISIHCTEELETNADSERGSASLPNTPRIPNKVKVKEKRTCCYELSVADTKEEGFEARERCHEKLGPNSHKVPDCLDTVVAGKSKLKTTVNSPVTQNSSSLASFPVVTSVSSHCGNDPLGEDAQRPDAQNGSTRNQVSKRKRNQGATVSKYDLLVTDMSSNRLDAEGAVIGAFDLLAAAGVNAHISTSDNRRLMQGARQLFSLAERKWR